MLSSRIWKYFGLKENPFTDLWFLADEPGIDTPGGEVELADSGNLVKIHDWLETLLECEGFGAISGPSKSGKSTAVEAFLMSRVGLPGPDGRELFLMRTDNPNPERITSSGLVDFMISRASGEKPKRSSEIRMQQWVRALGMASKTRHLLLYMDEAHKLKYDIFAAFKVMREKKWAGRHPLFTILLVGEEGLAAKAGRIDKVRDRCSVLQVGPPSKDDMLRYLKLRVGGLSFFKPAALAFIAAAGANYVQMNALAEEAMRSAYSAGSKTVGLDHALETYGRKKTKVLISACGITAETARRNAGVGMRDMKNLLDGCGSERDREEAHEKIAEALTPKLEDRGRRIQASA